MTDDTWGRVREDLIKSVGKNNYLTWIEPLEFDGLQNGVAQFKVPTNFIGNWVSRNFGDQIIQHLESSGADVDRIEFNVPRNGTSARPAETKPAELSNPPAKPREAQANSLGLPTTKVSKVNRRDRKSVV